MGRKNTTSNKGGRRHGIGERRPLKKTGQRVDNESIPLYFTARKPRSIAMVIGTRKELVQRLELAPTCSIAPKLEDEVTPTRLQGSIVESETPLKRVKIEEEEEEEEEEGEETSSTTTTTSMPATSSWLLPPEYEEMLSGPIPDLYSFCWDDTLS